MKQFTKAALRALNEELTEHLGIWAREEQSSSRHWERVWITRLSLLERDTHHAWGKHPYQAARKEAVGDG